MAEKYILIRTQSGARYVSQPMTLEQATEENMAHLEKGARWESVEGNVKINLQPATMTELMHNLNAASKNSTIHSGHGWKGATFIFTKAEK